MNLKHVDAKTLGDNIPPPSQNFYHDTMGKLRMLAAQEASTAHIKRKPFSTVLVAALLVVLLASSALALTTLQRSAEAARLTKARQALEEVYGLTTQAQGVFSPAVSKDGDTYHYIFHSATGNRDKLGIYTVTLSPGDEPQVSWTHDDIDRRLWEDGGLDAPAWGQKQILEYLHEKYADQLALENTDWANISLEQAAEYGQNFTIDVVEYGERMTWRMASIAPEASDFPLAQVEQVVRKHVMDTYGVSAESIAGYGCKVSLGKPDADPTLRQYGATLYKKDTNRWVFNVLVDGITGEPLSCFWHANPEERTLPEGDLSLYPQAVKEYFESGALTLQSAQVKADLLKWVQEAGIDDYAFENIAYVAYQSGDMVEQHVIDLANATLMETYGFTQETLAAFYKPPITSLVAEGDQRQWWVRYDTSLENDDTSLSHVWKKMGIYEVKVAAATGEVLSITWDLHDLDDGTTAYTRENLYTAYVYPARALPALLEIKKDMEAIIDRNPSFATSFIYDFSVEDTAQYHGLMREAGYSLTGSTRTNTVPNADELSQEEALAIVLQVLEEEMHFPKQVLSDYSWSVEFVETNETRQWEFVFYLNNEGVAFDGCVHVDAKTGQVLYTEISTGGNG